MTWNKQRLQCDRRRFHRAKAGIEGSYIAVQWAGRRVWKVAAKGRSNGGKHVGGSRVAHHLLLSLLIIHRDTIKALKDSTAPFPKGWVMQLVLVELPPASTHILGMCVCLWHTIATFLTQRKNRLLTVKGRGNNSVHKTLASRQYFKFSSRQWMHDLVTAPNCLLLGRPVVFFHLHVFSIL